MRNISLGKYAVFATLFLSSTNSYAQSAFGVYDATNKFVGNLISQQLVGMIINGIVTALPFDVNGLQEGNGLSILPLITVRDRDISTIRPYLRLDITPATIPSIMRNNRLKTSQLLPIFGETIVTH